MGMDDVCVHRKREATSHGSCCFPCARLNKKSSSAAPAVVRLQSCGKTGLFGYVSERGAGGRGEGGGRWRHDETCDAVTDAVVERRG